MYVSYPVKYFSFIVFVFATIFLASCSSSRKAASLTKHVEDSLPSLPPSEIDIPLKIHAPPILAKAEKVVPKEFTSDTWPNFIQPSCDFRYKYRFERSPLTINCVNNVIGVQFTGSYQLSGSRCICTAGKAVSPWISGSCGFGKEPMRKMTVSIRSQLNFLSTYQVRTTTSLNKLQAIDKCYVSLFSSDVTQLVLDSVQASVAAFCSTLDETITGLSFASLVREAAGKGYQKTNMGKYGFLLINPTSLRIGQLNYARDSFNIQAGISCKPTLSSDSINHINVLSTLPALQQKENKHGISLYLDANYEYAFLSKLLADTLRNKAFEIKGRTIVVKDVQMKGIGNHQVELRVDFAGSNKGSIFLRGTPVLDTAKQALSIPDISYSLEGQDLALKLARSLFRNKIKKTLKGNSYLDIGALVKTNMPLLNEQLNRQLTKGVYTTGKTTDIKVIGLLARDSAMEVQIFVAADLTVSSDGVF
jgi:hypothetical protein